MAVAKVNRVLEIPDQYRSGLVSVAKLSDASIVELEAALKRSPQAATRKELSAWITPEVKSITPADVPKIIDALASLYRVRSSVSVPAERLAKDVAAAMAETGSSELRIADENRTALQARLATLITLDSLNVAETKARELKAEYEHTFCESRILTDLRPVFGNNPSDSPSRMLIVHMLKLGYHDSNQSKHREFYVALDSEDLAALKDVIQRAETKANTLKSQLETVGVKPIEVE